MMRIGFNTPLPLRWFAYGKRKGYPKILYQWWIRKWPSERDGAPNANE